MHRQPKRWQRRVSSWRGQIIVTSTNMGRTLLSMAGALLLFTAAALAQEKGGEDETGPYEVVANWPQPWSAAGYIWGSQPAVFAQSPDRIFIGARGEIKAPDKPPRGFNGSWGSTGQRATE